MNKAEREKLKAEADEYLQRLMTTVYLHYVNRKDLDPVQEKHLELAKEARKRLRKLKDGPAARV